MLVAKNLEACRHLQEQFVQHDIKKKYIAILSSPPMEGVAKEGIITLPPSRKPFDSPRQTVNHRIGTQSITRYRLVGDTRVELFPETGRTHQLRIHCAHPEGLGRPIKGDILYGTAADRLYLHAESITFRHPTTGEWMTFTEKAF